MTAVTLRPARSTDAGKLGAMITEAVAARTWKPTLHTGAEDIAHAGALIERGWVTVAEQADTVTGFIAREDGYIHALFVAEGAQGNGIGRALLDDAMATKRDLTLWTFAANDGARRFYARAGFDEVAQGDGSGNDEGLPDVKLHWTRANAPTKETANG